MSMIFQSTMIYVDDIFDIYKYLMVKNDIK